MLSGIKKIVQKISEPKILVILTLGIATFATTAAITRHLSHKYTLSISPSVGRHYFKRVQCPEPLERWGFLEIKSPENDPFIPCANKMNLIKRIACLPGETVIRRKLEYWCKDAEGQLHHLGKVKLKSCDGRVLHPFMYDPAKPKATYTLAEDEIFVIGKPIESSYDSRYIGPEPQKNILACLEAIF